MLTGMVVAACACVVLAVAPFVLAAPLRRVLATLPRLRAAPTCRVWARSCTFPAWPVRSRRA